MANNKKSKNDHDDLIIYHPHALNPLRRGVEWSLTAIGWFVWAVLCRPLLLACLWFLGFEIFYEHMIRLGGINALVAFAYIYCTVVLIMYLFIRGWNFYNAKKFRKKNKRKNVRDVTTEDLDLFFKFNPQTIEKAQGWGSIVVSFQAKNQISLRRPSESDAQAYKGYFKSG